MTNGGWGAWRCPPLWVFGASKRPEGCASRLGHVHAFFHFQHASQRVRIVGPNSGRRLQLHVSAGRARILLTTGIVHGSSLRVQRGRLNRRDL